MPNRPSSRRLALITLLATLFAALGIVYWWALGTPRTIAEGESDRVQCLSYAPFRLPGETPFNESLVIPPERIAADLRLLRERTDCVRTYAGRQGLDAVPEIAQSLGMKVLLGVWLGRERDRNEEEVARGIELANRYPDTVKAVIVGNEVLLRRELPEAVVGEYIDRVRAAVRVPVTYADVWEFWMEHRALAERVSFVTIHILPYWEDHPVGIEGAIDHIVEVAEQMRQLFDGKDILIGETGWPSEGRSRRAAVAGRVNQARFFRQFSQAAAEHRLSYNFIEAFDQPWKRRLEGAMGGQWGLFDSGGEAKFPATGPVEEDPDAWQGFAGALLGLVLFGAMGYRRGLRGWSWLLAASVGTCAGAVMVAQWKYMLVWNRFVPEWTVTSVYALLGVAFAAVAVRAVHRRAATGLGSDVTPLAEAPGLVAAASIRRAVTIPPIAAVARPWRPGGGRPRGVTDWLGVLRFVFLFGVAAMAVLLVFDPRYRGFPWPLYALPLMALVLVRLAGYRTDVFDREEAALATVAAACAVVFILVERLSNLQALVFGLVVIALAGVATGFRYWRFRPWEERWPDERPQAAPFPPEPLAAATAPARPAARQ
jgi:exo-beta-1,3-glucanase (GH17 family)